MRTTSTATLTTTYSYDAANRIASITYPSGTVVSYTRDIMGRVTAISAQPSGGASAPVVSNITYEPFGPYTALTYGNGVAEARGFDQDYRLTGITDTGASVLQNLGYAYYPTNNVHTITDAVNSGNSQTFTYDNLQRLAQATGGYGAFGFTYDKDGNRLTQALGGVTTNYAYNPASDLLTTESVGGTVTQTIGYTADGRMASFSPGIQAPGGQYITALSYNQDGRLSAVNASGGALGSYTYDGFGQRLIKVAGSAGNLFQYGQDGMLLEETNASGTAQADYIYLGRRPVAVLNGSTLYYLHTNQLGTPQLATDSNQNAQWQASYDPFGQASVSGTITQNLRLPGQYFDVESGWNHNGFRNYLPDLGRYAEPDPFAMEGSTRHFVPATGRFDSEVPIGLVPGFGVYNYATNRPTEMDDPFGLAPRCKKHCNPTTPTVDAPRLPTVQSINAGLIQQAYALYLKCTRDVNWGKTLPDNACVEPPPESGSEEFPNEADMGPNDPGAEAATANTEWDLAISTARLCLQKFPLAVLDPRFNDIHASTAWPARACSWLAGWCK